MTSYIVVDGVRKLVLPAQHPAALARRGKAPTEVMSLENTIQQVYAPGFTAVIDVPAANIRHMPPASMNVTRLVLCANYNGNKGPHSCSMGERCKFVHADHVDVASLPKAHEIHVNYAWRSLADVTYERFPPGEMLTVAPPNSGESDAPDVMESQMALRTRALESRGGGRGGSHATAAAARPLTHCAHYYFNRTCNLGAGCQFVHAVFIDPEAKDHQRAPIPAQLGRHHGRGGRGGRGGGNQNGDRRGSNSGGGRGGASTNAQQQQRHPHQQQNDQNGANDRGYDNSNAYRGFDGRVRGDGDDLSYYNYNNNYVAVPSSAVGAEGTPMYHWLPHHAAENVVDELPPAMPAPAGRSRGGSQASRGSTAAGQSDDERSLTQQPQLAGVAAAVPPLQKAARHHHHADVWIAQDVTTSLESSTEEADLIVLQQHPSSSAAASLWCPSHHHRSNSNTTIETTTNTTLAAPKRSLYYSHYRHNPYSVAGPYEWCA